MFDTLPRHYALLMPPLPFYAAALCCAMPCQRDYYAADAMLITPLYAFRFSRVA